MYFGFHKEKRIFRIDIWLYKNVLHVALFPKTISLFFIPKCYRSSWYDEHSTWPLEQVSFQSGIRNIWKVLQSLKSPFLIICKFWWPSINKTNTVNFLPSLSNSAFYFDAATRARVFKKNYVLKLLKQNCKNSIKIVYVLLLFVRKIRSDFPHEYLLS